MADNFDERTFQIMSFAAGNPPIGISNDTEPSFQEVFAGAPLNYWTFHKAGCDTYNISIGDYMFVGGDHHGTIIATKSPEQALKWRIIRDTQQASEAFVIELESMIIPERVWTLRENDGHIELRAVLMPLPSAPRFLANDLFLLRPVC